MSNYDVIVIGSGIGGLACASLLTSLADKRVLVLERHFKPGGQTHDFRRRGAYEWDVGLHYVGEMEPGQGQRNLLDVITGHSVDWTPLPDPYDVFLYPGFRFDVPFGERRYLERLQARFPTQAAALERYFGDVHKAVHWMELQMAHKAMPPWMQLGTRLISPNHKQLALDTTAAYLDANISDPLLRTVLASQWADYGLTPKQSAFGIHALATASFFKGAYYPVGGARSIAQGALEVVEGGGGACLVNREVCELIVESNRVVGVVARHRQGNHETLERHYAPVVISDIGARNTYLDLMPGSEHEQAIRGFCHGHSAISVYLGLNDNPRRIGIEGANYWVFTDRDHDAMLARSANTLDGEPPYLFASFPGIRNPNTPTHTATLIITVDYESFEPWRASEWKRRGEGYEQLKQTIAEGALALAERELPGLRDLVDYVEVSTPLTMEHFTGRRFGAFYGVPAVPDKFEQPWCEIETPLEGLLLTGTDVACLGVVGAAMGGMLTTAKVLGTRQFGRVMSQMKAS